MVTLVTRRPRRSPPPTLARISLKILEIFHKRCVTSPSFLSGARTLLVILGICMGRKAKADAEGRKDTELSIFRNKSTLPDPDVMSPQEIWELTFRGVVDFVRSKEFEDWDYLADKAAELALTGLADETIAKTLGVSVEELQRYVDLGRVRLLVQGEVAKSIYRKAIVDGDTSMMKFIAERQMSWDAKKEVSINHSGEIGLKPILNIKMLDKDMENARRGSDETEGSGS